MEGMKRVWQRTELLDDKNEKEHLIYIYNIHHYFSRQQI